MPKRNKGPSLEWREERDVYEIVWFEKGKRRRKSTGTTSLSEAEEALQDFLAGAERGADRKIGVILADYLDEHGPDVEDPVRLAYAAEALGRFWGDLTQNDVTKTKCSEYVRWRLKNPTVDKRGKVRPISIGTARRELGTLASAMNHDHEEKRSPPPPKIRKPPRPKAKDRWLTRDEVAALLKAARAEPKARHHLPLFVLIGIYTAARRDDIHKLTWDRVDLRNRLIYFQTGPQTNKGKGVVRIPQRLLTFLRYARRRGTPKGPVLHDEAGQPFKRIKRSFATACNNAGLTGVSPHTLRHTSATWMAQEGVDLWEIRDVLGHKSIQTTEENYLHHTPGYQGRATEAFDRPAHRRALAG